MLNMDKIMYKLSEDTKDNLIDALRQAMSIWYDDNNGPWGYECLFCTKKSTDGHSEPEHDEDCEGQRLIKELLNLEEEMEEKLAPKECKGCEHLHWGVSRTGSGQSCGLANDVVHCTNYKLWLK